MYARHCEEDFWKVKALANLGLSGYEIADVLDVPRSTVTHWRARQRPPGQSRSRRVFGPKPADQARYSYLLGVYLGDGHIWATSGNSWRIGFTLDERYPGVINEVAAAIGAAFPGVTVCRNRKPGAVGLYASGVDWAGAFPQHGPGRKHLRRIELADWQREITHEHPRELLRGLIHSDGCRCINRFKTKLPSGRIAEYEYPRYFFTNLSEDIRGIFCEHCELLGVRWTQSNHRNISVSHRKSVARLDEFIGPKA